ncbi:hypothetical protein [Nonomuraea jabiensis]
MAESEGVAFVRVDVERFCAELVGMSHEQVRRTLAEPSPAPGRA